MLFLLFFAVLEAVCGSHSNDESFNSSSIEPKARRFSFRPSIFNIVRFSNDECYDGGNQSGTCYTPAECKLFGGSGTALCAKGYGTCCIISKSCHNTTSQKVVYFKNPSYPSTDNQANYCDLTIDIKDNDVCQVRLDLLDFQLDPPTNGECLGDRLSISASKLATNTVPTLCGLNRNSHLYINLPQESRFRSASLLFVTNSDGPYRWHLRITQIQCIKNSNSLTDLESRKQKSLFGLIPAASLKVSVPAPQGCLQYFTTRTGVVESFNFGNYLNNLDYAICIERHPETCKVVFTASLGDWSIDSSGSFGQSAGVGDTLCANDYLMIPGGSQTGSGITFDRYCGARLHYQKNSQDSAPVVTKANGPIVLRFHSDNIQSIERNEGFRVYFQQESVNCQSNTETVPSPLVFNLNTALASVNRLPNIEQNVLSRSNTKRMKV